MVGLKVRIRGVNRVRDGDRVRAGGGCVILFEKHLPPKQKWKNHLVRKKVVKKLIKSPSWKKN